MSSDNRIQLVERQLNALYQVSRVLSRSLDLHQTLKGMLEVLDEYASIRRGLVTLLDPESGAMLINAAHVEDDSLLQSVSYKPGEGIVGTILAEDQVVVIERIIDEPRFLDRLGIYHPRLPFIGVPIHVADRAVGVLAAQPDAAASDTLDDMALFMEMVANLIGQSVRLSWEVEKKQKALADERDRLRRQVRGNYGFDNIVGHTSVMRRVFEQIRQVAKWNTTVLIRGESGTGKELIANAIHYNSPRANNSFVKLNCAALPENLLESELFGHEKGAFTGATTQRKGRFEQADGGTIFLDEIGEISPAFQAKLLRVLQEGEFERVGGGRTIKVDVRVIAATNRNLEKEVDRGEFREDLYYRLNVMPIFMPALRERGEDIPQLANFLVNKIGKQQGRKLTITDSAIRNLMQYDWPGNVRELENCLERAAIMSESGAIDRDVIGLTGLDEKIVSNFSRPAMQLNPPAVELDNPDLDERERVIAALEQAGWVQAKAARLLGMTPRQIAYRIQILNINVRKL
ncbi:MAG: nif-specific transcriptional activator NifA [Pseudomonadota bacterium]